MRWSPWSGFPWAGPVAQKRARGVMLLLRVDEGLGGVMRYLPVDEGLDTLLEVVYVYVELELPRSAGPSGELIVS